MRKAVARIGMGVFVCLLSHAIGYAQNQMDWDAFKKAMMKRYDQQVVVTRVRGLQAGEQEGADWIGKGKLASFAHHARASSERLGRISDGLGAFSAPKIS